MHSHDVAITGDDTTDGTGIVLALYGVREDSYLVAGKYVSGWNCSSTSASRSYFSVPLEQGWAGARRHFVVNSGQPVPDYPDLRPNPPL